MAPPADAPGPFGRGTLSSHRERYQVSVSGLFTSRTGASGPVEVDVMELTRCPQCGLPAEVVDRDVWESTDGPVEHVAIRCVARHRFVMPVAMLATASPDDARAAADLWGSRVNHRPAPRVIPRS